MFIMGVYTLMKTKAYSLIFILVLITSILVSCNNNSDSNSALNANDVLENSQFKKEFDQMDIKKDERAKGINVTAYKNKNGDIYGFVVSGHSGYAEKGYDIVCSAVSILVLNTINSVERFTKDEIMNEVKDDGYVKCLVPSIKSGKGSSETKVLLKSMLAGLEDIQESYGENYVKVISIDKK